MTPPRWPVLVLAALAALLVLLAGCASAPVPPPPHEDDRRHIVVAVDNPLAAPAGRAGASLGAYGPAPRYQQGGQAAATLAALAAEHGLRPVAGWPIAPLGWQCVLFALPADLPDAARDRLLATLAADPRVRLAQPLQAFETHTTPAPAAAYNDPYLPLQHAFATLGAAQAHRTSAGAGVRIAVVDTGAATGHPELHGRIARTRDFVGPAAGFEADRHGTQVAGVIAAAGNNHQGIVGIAPLATLELHKACWQRADGPAGAAARCNSFTLAQALAAVLAGDARIVNLSLGGPADPLLDRLLAELLKQGRLVVAALPPSGQRGGFPTGTPGVIAAAPTGAPPAAADVVRAPGQDVLTLQPSGAYDYASGSSLAAAHVSAVAALLWAAEPAVDAARLRAALMAASPLNAQAALDALRTAPR